MNVASPIVWQPVRALDVRFAIESASPIVLERARSLFAPWIIENARAPISRRWRIDADGKTDGKIGSRTEDDRLYSVADAGRDFVTEGVAPPNWQRRGLSELLTQIEFSAIAHLVANLPPQFVGLHGALLSREFEGARRAIVVVGPKEAGKSTLACALWRAGWSLHCDDFCLLDERGRAHPTARRVSLRDGSRELLGELWQQAQQTPNLRPSAVGLLFHPHEIAGEIAPVAEPLPIGAICFLKRRGVELLPAQTAWLGQVEAAFALLPYSTLLLENNTLQTSTQCADWGAKLGVLAERIAGLSFYDVGRGELQTMVRSIEQLFAPAESNPR